MRTQTVFSDDDKPFEVTGLAQRSSWMAREVPPVEQLRTDLWSIPVPMPISPLRYTSVYVFASDDGVTLIDAGWESEASFEALRHGLATFGATMADVRGVLVTHQHFDHIGLARRVREESGAWIALHEADRDAIVNPDFRDPDRAAAAEERWLTWLGADPEEARKLGDPVRFASRATVAIPDRLIADGQDVGVPGWTLRAVHTPGHTPGHLCFVDQGSGLMFAGDHILPRISPNISADRRPDVDALGNYLASLVKIGEHEVDEVLPAHEWRFAGLRARINQLLEHHEHRLAELLAVVRAHPGWAPWDLASKLTWSRAWDEYDGRMRISAVSETMSHVKHLLERGLITRSEEAVPRYYATDSS